MEQVSVGATPQRDMPIVQHSNATGLSLLLLCCLGPPSVILFVVYRIAVRWAKRRTYLAEVEAKRNPRALAAPPPAPSVAAAGARVFGPSESAAIAAGAISASNRRPKRPSRNSVAPAPAPSGSPSPSVSGMQGPPLIPRLHLLAPPGAPAPEPGGSGYAVVQSSAASPSPSPRSFLGMAVSPREIEIESARGAAVAASQNAGPAASSSAPSAAPFPAAASSSSSSSQSPPAKPTIAVLPPVFLHAAPTSAQRGRTLPPLQHGTSASSFATAATLSPPSPAAGLSPSPPPREHPLSLIDRTQHLSFGQRAGGGGAGSGSYAALSVAAAAASGSGSGQAGGNLTPRTPRSFGGRTETPPSSPPPRLRTPTRHASSGSVGGHMSPAARAALAEPLDAPEYGLDAAGAGLGSVSASSGSSLCGICLSRPSDAFLVPCGHSNFCFGCVQRWTSGAAAHEQTCPVCRTAVQSVAKMVSSPQTPKR